MSDRPIMNATQHPASAEQRAVGVHGMTFADQEYLMHYLNFNELPDKTVIENKANAIAELVATYCRRGDKVMIGGAPYLMATLEQTLKDAGFIPVYAFSQRESVEQTQDDGSVKKINIFRHLGFVEA